MLLIFLVGLLIWPLLLVSAIWWVIDAFLISVIVKGHNMALVQRLCQA